MIRVVDSFVIRLWSPADQAEPADGTPHGVIRHVGSGQSGAFKDGDELLALLRDLPRRGEGATDQEASGTSSSTSPV